MNRSIMSRNLAGGFLGGALGILISWYVAPMALPFGVLLGVVVGWWAEDIIQMFIHSARSAISILERHEQIKALLCSRLNRCGTAASTVAREVVRSIQYIVALPSLLFMLPFLLIRRFRQWAMHPTGKALLIKISAIMIGATINALAFSMLWPWPETMTVGGGMSGKPEEVVQFGLVNIVLFTFLATMIPVLFGIVGVLVKDNRGGGMRDFYARWERYSQYSPITYFARELIDFFKSEVFLTIFVALTITYWVTLGGALIALIMIPVATFVTFMVGLYKIAKRSAHWWCLGVTLATTCISALVFYNSFDNEAVLWTVALCTGFSSGVATEGLRRFGLWWSNTEMGQYYLDIWYDNDKVLPFSVAIPAWRTLLRAFDNVGQRVIESTVWFAV